MLFSSHKTLRKHHPAALLTGLCGLEIIPLFGSGARSLALTALLCCRFRFNLFDNPVIFSSSDQPTTQTPEKPMVQVTNPFALELGSGSACVADGVSVKLSCLQPCVLTCFWGCEVGALQGALQTQQRDPRLRSPHHLLDALQLHCRYCESFHVSSRDGEEHRTCVPAYLGVTDFGPLPRHHYPLVAVLTLAEPADRDRYNIVANAAVIHVPDEKHNLSSRILFQYLLTSQGHTYELKVSLSHM
uniref:Cell growth regulator with ring finger domain 1 n=1 Tax=Nothobranchius furzeri TaxID=105023 RepID=A0A8C6KR80_NOTFU